jgi:hypothetical protein
LLRKRARSLCESRSSRSSDGSSSGARAQWHVVAAPHKAAICSRVRGCPRGERRSVVSRALAGSSEAARNLRALGGHGKANGAKVWIGLCDLLAAGAAVLAELADQQACRRQFLSGRGSCVGYFWDEGKSKAAQHTPCFGEKSFAFGAGPTAEER